MEGTTEIDQILSLVGYPSVESVPKELIDKLISYDSSFSFEASMKSPISNSSIMSKLTVFYSLQQEISSYIKAKSLNQTIFYYDLWKFYLPYALHLQDCFQKSQRPWVQGVVGVQGAGKTTFTEVIVLILQKLNLKVCAVSIDDFYKTYAERQIIKQKDARFKWRGPPGTHDLNQAIDLISSIKKQKSPYSLPVFDKSLFQGEGDRIQDISVEKIDIFLFEGWFVGMRPLAKGHFLEDKEFQGDEKDRQFAEDVARILEDYCVLWDLLDDLIILWPDNVDFSKKWRVEAEEKMKDGGKEGKSKSEIEEFVEYFWKAVHPKIYIRELCEKNGASFKFNFDVTHKLNKIEAYLKK